MGSIPILDNNWLCCANQVVMLDDSDEEIPVLEDLSLDNIEVQHRPVVVRSPHGLNVAAIDARILFEEIYATHGVSPVDLNESTTVISDEIIEESMPSIRHIHVDGPSTGRSRIVPVAFSVAAEYVDDDSESDTSSIPGLVTLSSSESEYFYSDDERDSFNRFFDDDDYSDGIGLLVNEVTSDSDESSSNENVFIEGYQNLTSTSTFTSGERQLLFEGSIPCEGEIDSSDSDDD